jgi:hypothetical protein
VNDAGALEELRQVTNLLREEIYVRNPLPKVDSAPILPGSGVDLVGLTERVRLACGQLDHEAVDGQFRLSAWLPWPRDPRAVGR